MGQRLSGTGARVAQRHVEEAATEGAGTPRVAGPGSHAAVVYRGSEECRRAIDSLMLPAVAAGEALQVVLPDHHADVVRDVVAAAGADQEFCDMASVGRNPARIIPSALTFADAQTDRSLCCVWEPVWPERSAAEVCEVARHEALCNLAFTGRRVAVACLYDADRLPAAVVDQAWRTHPVVVEQGHRQDSPRYLGPGIFPPGCDDPLSNPPADARRLDFCGDLAEVRTFAASWAHDCGLASWRATDLVMAVSELAANVLAHTFAGAVIQAWGTGGELICQVDDSGHITDPLAGRRRRPPDAPGGHGLWLVNQVCDLVQTRSGPAGTTTRVHMLRAAAQPAAGAR